MEDEWITFNLKLRPDMTEALDQEANELGISRAALIRVICAQHLNHK